MMWRAISAGPYTWVGLLHFLGLFIILGIGADDIYVVIEFWRQARDEPEATLGGGGAGASGGVRGGAGHSVLMGDVGGPGASAGASAGAGAGAGRGAGGGGGGVHIALMGDADGDGSDSDGGGGGSSSDIGGEGGGDDEGGGGHGDGGGRGEAGVGWISRRTTGDWWGSGTRRNEAARLAWTLRHSVSAMAATSLTTAAAFMVWNHTALSCKDIVGVSHYVPVCDTG